MKKHAILLSGGINFRGNYKRYRNDLEFAYCVLIENCGFQKEDIEVFFANGVNLNYKGKEIKTKEASKQNIIKALEYEKNTLDIQDELVFVVSNHGGLEDEGFINLWGKDIITLKNLSEDLEQVSARKILLLGQCYAGNILQYNIKNACVMTANMRGMPSYASPYNTDYDEFLYHFFSYIHGHYPDGKSLNKQGENDVKKAFQYAVDMDIFSPTSIEGDKLRFIVKKNLIEIPQIKCDIDQKIKL